MTANAKRLPTPKPKHTWSQTLLHRCGRRVVPTQLRCANQGGKRVHPGGAPHSVHTWRDSYSVVGRLRRRRARSSAADGVVANASSGDAPHPSPIGHDKPRACSSSPDVSPAYVPQKRRAHRCGVELPPTLFQARAIMCSGVCVCGENFALVEEVPFKTTKLIGRRSASDLARVAATQGSARFATSSFLFQTAVWFDGRGTGEWEATEGWPARDKTPSQAFRAT